MFSLCKELQDWLRPVFQPMKTDENCTELVDTGLVQFFEVLQPVRTSLGPGLVKFWRKTRLDWTSKHEQKVVCILLLISITYSQIIAMLLAEPVDCAHVHNLSWESRYLAKLQFLEVEWNRSWSMNLVFTLAFIRQCDRLYSCLG